MEFIIGANPNNKENKLKMTVVLTKNANILSTNILRKCSNNTIETKDDNTYQDFILSSNKKNVKNDIHLCNSSDNENDDDLKNKTKEFDIKEIKDNMDKNNLKEKYYNRDYSFYVPE